MTDSFIIYHNPRCSKSRLVLRMLRRQEEGVEVIKYLENPPSEEILIKALKIIGREALLRKGEDEYYRLIRPNLKSLQNDELARIMIENPNVIERPLVIAPDGRMMVGRPPEIIEKLFS